MLHILCIGAIPTYRDYRLSDNRHLYDQGKQLPIQQTGNFNKIDVQHRYTLSRGESRERVLSTLISSNEESPLVVIISAWLLLLLSIGLETLCHAKSTLSLNITYIGTECDLPIEGKFLPM